MSAKKSTLSSTFKQFLEAPTQLGELLMRAGMIDQRTLGDVSAIGQHVPGRLGQLLVMAGHITHEELQDALQVQCLMREHILDKSSAVQALRMTRGKRISLQAAIESLQPQQAPSSPTSRLGDLLVDAEILTREAVEDALQKNAATGLPLGRVLVLSGAISDELLIAALNAQVVLRRGGIDRDDALRTIRNAHEMYTERRQSQLAERERDRAILPAQHAFIRDVLIAANAVSEEAFTQACRDAAENEWELSTTLQVRYSVSPQLMKVAYEMMALVGDGLVSKQWCLSTIENACSTTPPPTPPSSPPIKTAPPPPPTQFPSPTPLPPPKPDPDHPPQIQDPPKRPTFIDFLVLCRTVKRADLDKLSGLDTRTELLTGLTNRLGLDEAVIDVGDLCFALVQDNKLSLDEAVFAFEYLSYEVTTGRKRLHEAAEKLAFHNGIWAPFEAVTAA